MSIGIIGVSPFDANGGTMIIKNSQCLRTDKEDNTLLTGTRKGGLYYLDRDYKYTLYDNIDDSLYYKNMYLNFNDVLDIDSIIEYEEDIICNINTASCTESSYENITLPEYMKYSFDSNLYNSYAKENLSKNIVKIKIS